MHLLSLSLSFSALRHVRWFVSCQSQYKSDCCWSAHLYNNWQVVAGVQLWSCFQSGLPRHWNREAVAPHGPPDHPHHPTCLISSRWNGLPWPFNEYGLGCWSQLQSIHTWRKWMCFLQLKIWLIALKDPPLKDFIDFYSFFSTAIQRHTKESIIYTTLCLSRLSLEPILMMIWSGKIPSITLDPDMLYTLILHSKVSIFLPMHSIKVCWNSNRKINCVFGQKITLHSRWKGTPTILEE